MQGLTDFLIDEKQWVSLSLVSAIQELIYLLIDKILREIGCKFILCLSHIGINRFING